MAWYPAVFDKIKTSGVKPSDPTCLAVKPKTFSNRAFVAISKSVASSRPLKAISKYSAINAPIAPFMEVTMARGPEINNFVIRIIGEVADENPEFTAKEVTQAVQARLQRENLQAKPNWPGLSIVQNKMKEIRDEKFEQEPLGKDGPWSVGKLADFEIPFQAVPKLLTIQQLRSGYSPLTIREAKWIGRLQTVVDDVTDLAMWATLYAKREKICEQSNIEKDTSDIDPSLNAKVVTLPLYFQWLFKQDWIPDKHKSKVAIEQAQRYEEVLGIKAKLPNFSTLGWLIYAGGLQELVLELPTRKNVSKGIRQFETLLLRLLANKEGKAQPTPSQYIDILDG
jgi:hypothetical protein